TRTGASPATSSSPTTIPSGSWGRASPGNGHLATEPEHLVHLVIRLVCYDLCKPRQATRPSLSASHPEPGLAPGFSMRLPNAPWARAFRFPIARTSARAHRALLRDDHRFPVYSLNRVSGYSG